MFCDNCGNEVENGSNFCPKCGAKFETKDQKTSPNEITGELDSEEVLRQILLSKSNEENNKEDLPLNKGKKSKKKKRAIIIIIIIAIIAGGSYGVINYTEKIDTQISKVNSDINSGNLTKANTDLQALENLGGPFVKGEVQTLTKNIQDAQNYAQDIEEINNAIANKDTDKATGLIKELEGKDLPTNIQQELAKCTSNLTTLMTQIENENLTNEKAKIEQQLQDVIGSISSISSGYTISTMTPEDLTNTLNHYFTNSAKNTKIVILTDAQLAAINNAKGNTDLQDQIKSNLQTDYSGATNYIVGYNAGNENSVQKTTITVDGEPAYIVKYQNINDIGTDKYEVTFVSASGTVYTAEDIYNAMNSNKLSSEGYIFGYNGFLKTKQSIANDFKNSGYKSKDGMLTYSPS